VLSCKKGIKNVTGFVNAKCVISDVLPVFDAGHYRMIYLAE